MPKVQRRGFLDGFFGSEASDVKAPESARSPPSWAELEALLQDAEAPEVQQDAEESLEGRGRLRADKSTVRLFDAAGENEVKVAFYRDHASWCPYCEKVQLALEEARVPYKITKVPMNCYGDKPLSFLAKNPMGLLPVAEIDGDLITESNLILEELVYRFPSAAPLVPQGREGEVASLLRLERRVFGSWFTWLRSPGGEETLKGAFVRDLNTVEQHLASCGGPFFLGEQFSMVECHFAPFLERMAASLAYFKGFQMRRNPDYPALEKWFSAMEAKPYYAALASDFYTHAHALPPQVGMCTSNGENEDFRRMIDGVGNLWTLPLPEEPTPLEPFLNGTSEQAQAARLEAARKLVGNRKAVVRFCLRGRGGPGFPPVSAPLSDPRAGVSNDAGLEQAVDEALRSVAEHLVSQGGAPMPAEVVGPVAWPLVKDVPECLEYLRDRIGVPRDLSYPGARQLRAHLNSYLAAVAAVQA